MITRINSTTGELSHRPHVEKGELLWLKPKLAKERLLKRETRFDCKIAHFGAFWHILKAYTFKMVKMG